MKQLLNDGPEPERDNNDQHIIESDTAEVMLDHCNTSKKMTM